MLDGLLFCRYLSFPIYKMKSELGLEERAARTLAIIKRQHLSCKDSATALAPEV